MRVLLCRLGIHLRRRYFWLMLDARGFPAGVTLCICRDCRRPLVRRAVE